MGKFLLFSLVCLIAIFSFNYVASAQEEGMDWVATASSVEKNYTPRLAIDGSLNTRWSSEFSNNQWWMVDLGKLMEINKITLYWEAAYAKSYKILVSSDRTSWQEVYTTSQGRGGPEAIRINPVTVRYVKLLLGERATQWGYSLWEVKFNGLEVPPEGEPVDLEVSPEGEPVEINWEW